MANLDLQQLKDGDETALRQFFDELYPLLLRATQIGLGRYETEDVVHEAIFKIYKNIDKAPTESKERLFGWCKHVALNVARDFYRKSRRRRIECRNFEEESPINVDPTLTEQYAGLLDRFLKELSEDEQNLVQHRLAGMSMVDIARELDVSERDAYMRYHFAIQKLRERLSSDLDE